MRAPLLSLLLLTLPGVASAQIEVDASGQVIAHGQAKFNSRIGLGTVARADARAFLAYDASSNASFGFVVAPNVLNAATLETMGIRVEMSGRPGYGYGTFSYGGYTGVFGGAQGVPGTTPQVIGVYGLGWGAQDNYGLAALAYPNGTGQNARNFGVSGVAFGAGLTSASMAT